jgi:hypothetical protein
MRRVPDHVTRAVELLAPGAWIDGRTFSREIKRLIWAGRAHRVALAERDGHRQRMGVTPERMREDRTFEADAAAGKQTIMRSMIGHRVRDGRWEVDPWPLTAEEWQTGAWRIRLIPLVPLSRVAASLRASVAQVRKLLLEEPPVPHVVRGRFTYVHKDQFPELEQRVNHARATKTARGNATRRARRTQGDP